MPVSRSREISDRTVKRCEDGRIWLVNQTNHQWFLDIWELLLHHPKWFFLSHGSWLAEPWLYSGPYLSSSTLQFRQSSVPLPVFPWQLLWQQPPLDQPPIHGVTLEWPLHGSVKRTHVDKEIQEGVIIMITETLITVNSLKSFSSVSLLHSCISISKRFVRYPIQENPMINIWGQGFAGVFFLLFVPFSLACWSSRHICTHATPHEEISPGAFRSDCSFTLQQPN